MKLKTLTPLLLIAAASALLSGCASPAKTVVETGFLDNYSQLRDGEKGEARYVYIDHRSNFTKYTKVNIMPVTIWRSDDSEMDELPPEVAQKLANDLHTAVYNEISKDYEIVDTTGPDTLLLRVALTEAVGANSVMNTVSTVVPVGLVVSEADKVISGSHPFVGKASIEVELLDSDTGERLAAAVDGRDGSIGFGAKWTQVEKAFNFWAEKMRDRLKRLTTASRLKQNLLDVKL
ncbi:MULTISPECIES: DUF3313 domain-containing protein [unclassified Lentimonas]|uniref:DUF3313 domain-containing protein n=1 Tax=unclassified Lentimonas TaxID=2630993 RepID=UPI001323DE63|nr:MULTISPECIES: DUF3313 domain-containing protein [unclassified Lentimonas]CAA6677305.1 Unannotated [Lentimonas sp. CC4]CAA6686850.1 Unannotated [Lentimonas sp. CC6]CAA6691189.1 Unannotated [Lentimonas sp. CC19]CAA6694746.1 Unannotated [Lentimonas sp. CC10]CAA7071569.1 Unannotated [Lentimonas sp. CC11]